MNQIIKAIPAGGSIKLEITRTKDEKVQVFLQREFPDAKVPLHPMLVVGTEDEIKDELNSAIRAYRVGTDSIVQQVEHALAASQKAADKKVDEEKAKPNTSTASIAKKPDAKPAKSDETDAAADKATDSPKPASPELEGAAGLFS